MALPAMMMMMPGVGEGSPSADGNFPDMAQFYQWQMAQMDSEKNG